MPSAKPVLFYFDPVSPYAWLASLQFARLDAAGLAVDARPVLFAGLLGKHGTLGPAEIPAKRAHLFRDVMREAVALGTTMTGPPGHPFNPLRALRLCAATEDVAARRRLTVALLDATWRDGRDLTDATTLAAIAQGCGLDGAALVARTDEPAVKARLTAATADAVARGVFGVPTFELAGELFWGADRIDALLRRAAGEPFDEAYLATVLARPMAAVRKG